MKAQATTLSIIFLVSLIVGGLIFFIGFNQIKNTEDSISQAEYNLLIKNIEHAFKKFSEVRGKGSKEMISFYLPKGVKEVCFLDKSKEYNPLNDPQLTYLINKYRKSNVFVKSKSIDFQNIKGFTLDNVSNPLCLKAIRNKLILKLENTGNTTKIISTNSKLSSEKCSSLLLNGDDASKLNIVFVGSNYINRSKLTQDALKYVKVFRKVEPFSSNINKFNFYVSNSLIRCDANQIIECDSFTLKKSASMCPNDYVIVLYDRSKLKDTVFPLRSSSYSNIEKINILDDELVVVHEFGHAFGDLWDEYDEDKYYSKFVKIDDFGKLPNCDEMNCPSWRLSNGSYEKGASCYKGCTLSSFYRATKNSIMNNFRRPDGKTFGPVNENILEKKLRYYK